MDKHSLEPILEQHPFLHGMAREHLDLIVGCASNVRFDPGQHLFHEGDEAKKFYIVRTGLVGVEMKLPGKGVLTVQTVTENEILGWSWLFPPYKWHFDARALQMTRAIALDGECLRKKCETDNKLGYELLKRFSDILEQRIQSMRLQMLDMYSG